MQNSKNLVLFLVLSFFLLIAWAQVQMVFFPPPKPARPNGEEVAKTEAPAPTTKGKSGAAAGAIAGSFAKKFTAPPPPLPRPSLAKLPPVAPATPFAKLLPLGSAQGDSRFHLQVLLDPRGAAVRSVTLNKFQQADDMGKPVWTNPPTDTIPKPLELIPDFDNREVGSDVLYHFRNPDDDRPLDTLGKTVWKATGPVATEKMEDGRERQIATFETDIQGVHITKTFTLTEGEYHVGLEVKLSRPKTETTPKQFRYQLAGAHGLPIEGRWYTSVFRNALILRGKDNRDIQTLPEISRWEGGKEIVKEPGWPIRYAGVAVQYFASLIVVDDKGQANQDFLQQARPTLETGMVRGVVTKIDRERNTFVVKVAENDERIFHVGNDNMVRDEYALLRENQRRGVVYETTGLPEPTGGKYDMAVATRIAPEMMLQPMWDEDVTVRVNTDAFELKPGESVTQKYLLYNGPLKPSLLAGQTGAAAVAPELVNRYAYDLSLNTMTDYPSSNPVARFFNYIGWTKLIILFTNLMHRVLGILHMVLPSYGICIIVLTVMVRGMMFPLSRKQTMTTMKMQELAPEMKRIQERFKDDPQGRGQAQMELYKRHKINPLGSCWLLLLQMPIFMGLYFALQESIQFRLAPFWPTWIQNLAAPDMMIYWGQRIPWLSRPEDYGGFLYLGPYLNLLPVVAVALMILQQKVMTPPATNEEEAMRNSMMKYMTVFFGLMFYKMASGLCLYFVATSVWGFAERKLLPKKKPAAGGSVTDGDGQAARTALAADSPRGRRRPERTRREVDNSPLGRLRSWWQEVLKQAEKK